ncbi:MAG: hypothetical protein KDA85_20825, partial [Planctomycetaceae bacterium]|nr:hypothetical protein [Planctomycetaceae bacterium]
LNNSIAETREVLHQRQMDQKNLAGQAALAEQQHRIAVERCQDEQQQLQQRRQHWLAARIELQTLLQSLIGVDLAPDVGSQQADDLSAQQRIIAQLQERVQEWERVAREVADLTVRIESTEQLVREKQLVRERRQQQLAEENAAVDQLKQSLIELQRERYQQLEERDPDIEESRMMEALEQSRAEFLQQQKSVAELTVTLTRCATVHQTVVEQLAAIQQRESSASALLQQELAASLFQDEAELRAAIRTPDQIEELQQQDNLLREHLAVATRSLENLHQQQAALRQEQPTTKSQAEVKAEQDSLEQTIEQHVRQLAELDLQLRQDQQQRAQLARQQDDLARRREQLQPLLTLNHLIGCATGTRYRRFAQGITFDQLLAGANVELKKLSDRYLLKRRQGEDLELAVLDHYHGSIERSVRNLSGGEGFLVSLALALGLSKLASRNVRIDSLFLDEGFGTLDSDTLDVALHALSGLQQEGKLVGLISHVTELNNQIPTQLKVQRIASGRSRLSGPGVCEMA